MASISRLGVLCVLGLVASPLAATQSTDLGSLSDGDSHLAPFHLDVPHDIILDAFDFNGDHRLNHTEFLCLVLSLPIDLTTHGEDEETSHSGHDHRRTTDSHDELHEACPYVHDEHDEHDGHDDHDSHDHKLAGIDAQYRRARRAVDAIVWAAKERKTSLREHRRARRQSTSTLTVDNPFELMVCDEEDTFAVFELADANVDEELDATEMTFAMPYLLELILRCSVEESSACSRPTVAQFWGYSILSVVLISLTSLCGIAVIPFMHKNWQHFVSDILIAFAVGALVGDALMHLLPAAYGAHSHGEGPESTVEVEPVFLGALAFVSVLFFFIIERVVRHIHTKYPDEADAGVVAKGNEEDGDDVPMTPAGRKLKELEDGNESEDELKERNWRDVQAVGYLNLVSDFFSQFLRRPGNRRDVCVRLAARHGDGYCDFLPRSATRARRFCHSHSVGLHVQTGAYVQFLLVAHGNCRCDRSTRRCDGRSVSRERPSLFARHRRGYIPVHWSGRHDTRALQAHAYASQASPASRIHGARFWCNAPYRRVRGWKV